MDEIKKPGPRWPNDMKQEHWGEMWNVRDIGFHLSKVHPDLLKYETTILKPTCRVYVPLCGKSVDLVYLADQGYDVVGSEFVKKAIEEFFEEQNLEYSVVTDNSTNIPIYKAVSKKISIYQGDFFELTSNIIGKFETIWDRASIIAINPTDREKYAKVLLDVMAPKCVSLINMLKITGKDYVGPPHSVEVKDIQALFGNSCEVKEVEATHFPFQHPTIDSIKITNVQLVLMK